MYVARKFGYYRIVVGLLLLVSGVLCASDSARAEGKVVYIFFAGGQSNAVPEHWGEGVKRGLSASGKYGDFRFVAQKHSGESIWNWVGFSRNKDGEMLFSRNTRDTGQTKGNTGANYAEDFFNDQGTGALQKVVNEVKANGDIPRVGLFWFQGEGDTGEKVIDRWEGSFTAMLKFIQEDVGQQEPVTFGLAIIDNNRDDPKHAINSEKQALVDKMRTIQAKFSDHDQGVVVDSRPYKRMDPWHLLASDSERFGFDLAAAYAGRLPKQK